MDSEQSREARSPESSASTINSGSVRGHGPIITSYNSSVSNLHGTGVIVTCNPKITITNAAGDDLVRAQITNIERMVSEEHARVTAPSSSQHASETMSFGTGSTKSSTARKTATFVAGVSVGVVGASYRRLLKRKRDIERAETSQQPARGTALADSGGFAAPPVVFEYNQPSQEPASPQPILRVAPRRIPEGFALGNFEARDDGDRGEWEDQVEENSDQVIATRDVQLNQHLENKSKRKAELKDDIMERRTAKEWKKAEQALPHDVRPGHSDCTKRWRRKKERDANSVEIGS